MRKYWSATPLLLAIWIASCVSTQAGERLALLIGNQGYNDKVGSLKNPHNDIVLVGHALEKIGFKVTIVKDAGYKSMDTAIKQHVATVRRAGKDAINFFYYSGHGAANAETRINYLVPVDAADADDASLWVNSIEQHDIIDRFSKQAPNAIHYVVFDACRNELQLTSRGKKALGVDKGMVPVAQTASMLIAYATAPGQTASDKGERAGPYATALAQEIVKPGIEAVTMFRTVQLQVQQSIGQDPWLTFPTLRAVYLAGEPTGEGKTLVIATPAAALTAEASAIAGWIKQINDNTTLTKLAEWFGAPHETVKMRLDNHAILHAGSPVELDVYKAKEYTLYLLRTVNGERLGYGIMKDYRATALPTPIPYLFRARGERNFDNIEDFTFEDLQGSCSGKLTEINVRYLYTATPGCYFGKPGSYANYAFGFYLPWVDCRKEEQTPELHGMNFADISCPAYKKIKPNFAFVSRNDGVAVQRWAQRILEFIYWK